MALDFKHTKENVLFYLLIKDIFFHYCVLVLLIIYAVQYEYYSYVALILISSSHFVSVCFIYFARAGLLKLLHAVGCFFAWKNESQFPLVEGQQSF